MSAPEWLAGLALGVVAKATLLLLMVALAQAAVLRRSSAATRHLVWSLAFASLLLLPLLTIVLPRWDLPVPVTLPWSLAEVETSASDREHTRLGSAVHILDGLGSESAWQLTGAESSVGRISPPMERGTGGSTGYMIWAVYLSVAVLLLVRLARQSLMPRRIERRATPVDDPDWAAQLREASAQLGLTRPVSLLRVKSSVIPMVWGTRRPVVVIPAEADGWPTEQRRTVLLHELAHVARHDCAVQVLTGVIAALYWFHPGVWWAGRRMRVERELACDDRVLGAGAHPHDYARQLLELAFMLRVPPALSFALGMARPSQLEVRMLAILDQSRERSAPARAAAWRISMGAAVCLIPLATTGFTQSASAEASASGVALAANASADPGSGTTSISAATGAPVDFPFTPDEVPFERPGVRRLRWEQQQASLSSSDPGSVREPTAELQPGRASGAAGTQSIHDAGIDPGGDSRVSLQIVSDSLTEEVSVRVLVERPERMSIVSVQPRDSSAIHRERETLTVVPTRRPRH